MDDTNSESLNHGLTGTDKQFHSQDPMADINNVESSVPSLTEMLAVISESRELTQNLQDLIQFIISVYESDFTKPNGQYRKLNGTQSERGTV